MNGRGQGSAVLSEEAAIKGNLDLDHENCERVGPVHGVTGDPLHIVCRFNGGGATSHDAEATFLVHEECVYA